MKTYSIQNSFFPSIHRFIWHCSTGTGFILQTHHGNRRAYSKLRRQSARSDLIKQLTRNVRPFSHLQSGAIYSTSSVFLASSVEQPHPLHHPFLNGVARGASLPSRLSIRARTCS